jgi:hypothetical protein
MGIGIVDGADYDQVGTLTLHLDMALSATM